jgi:hypothetical protein
MQKKTSFWLSPKGIAALSLIGAASYFLLIEHREHVWQFLPFLIIFLCPLMHVFMHGGHGKHNESQDHNHMGEHHSEPTSFKEKQQQGDAYREGYIKGLKSAREEKKNRDKHDGQ